MSVRFNIKHQILNLADLEALLKDEGSPIAHTVFYALDLTGCDEVLARRGLLKCVILGCQIGSGLQGQCLDVTRNNLLIPSISHLAFTPFRQALYTADELYRNLDIEDPASFFETSDWKIYSDFVDFTQSPPQTREETIDLSLLRRVHDHSISEALDRLVDQQPRLAAIMGGHRVRRDSSEFKQTASLAYALAANGVGVATGGGPGLMEAANLGARFASGDTAALNAAIGLLGEVPDFSEPFAWLRSALTALQSAPAANNERAGVSLGIPTWRYGHEPSNVFGTSIAKYFENSLREEGLLAIAKTGVIFAPGSAGTVQEIFQDFTQNAYRTYGINSQMILFDSTYWTDELPAWPLLKRLAERHDIAESVHLVDDPDEAVTILTAKPR